jgi:hypothetical protein
MKIFLGPSLYTGIKINTQTEKWCLSWVLNERQVLYDDQPRVSQPPFVGGMCCWDSHWPMALKLSHLATAHKVCKYLLHQPLNSPRIPLLPILVALIYLVIANLSINGLVSFKVSPSNKA